MEFNIFLLIRRFKEPLDLVRQPHVSHMIQILNIHVDVTITSSPEDWLGSKLNSESWMFITYE